MNWWDYLDKLNNQGKEAFFRNLEIDIMEYKYKMAEALKKHCHSWKDIKEWADLATCHYQARVVLNIEEMLDDDNGPYDSCNVCGYTNLEPYFEREHIKKHKCYGLQCPECGSQDIDDISAG